ncbi:hypothetical protein Tco_0023056, partial [Tanacetum coccineum]
FEGVTPSQLMLRQRNLPSISFHRKLEKESLLSNLLMKLELAKQMSLEAHQEKGEGEGDDADMERAIKLSLDPSSF